MKTIEVIIKRLSEFGSGIINLLSLPMEIIVIKLKQNSAHRHREAQKG